MSVQADKLPIVYSSISEIMCNCSAVLGLGILLLFLGWLPVKETQSTWSVHPTSDHMCQEQLFKLFYFPPHTSAVGGDGGRKAK